MTNTLILGSCLCGNSTVATVNCDQLKDQTHFEVFCSHKAGANENWSEEVDKVQDRAKGDTWVLAVILLLLAMIFLLAGLVGAVCQNKKNMRGIQRGQNIQQIWSMMSKKEEDEISIEWSQSF